MSFRDGPKDQTRNLEIPGSRSARPGMTLSSELRSAGTTIYFTTPISRKYFITPG